MIDRVYRRFELPEGNTWVECLGFMVQTMERTHPSFNFVVGLLSYAIKYNGLTQAQADAIQPQYDAHIDAIYLEMTQPQAAPVWGKLELIDGGKA